MARKVVSETAYHSPRILNGWSIRCASASASQRQRTPMTPSNSAWACPRDSERHRSETCLEAPTFIRSERRRK